MSRPAGEPPVLAAGSRSMAGAAGALRDVRGRLRGTTSFVVAAGSWKGPASEAFAVNGAGFQTGLEQAADVLDQAAGALSELAARLEHAQAAWDRAQRLAAVVGVDLDPHGDPSAHPLRRDRNPDGGLLSPATASDPTASVVAGQAVGMAEAAEHEAAAARRVAASRLDQAGHAPARARGGGGAVGRGPDPRGHEGLVQRAVGRVLEAGAEVATATHHLAAAAETRVQAAARLAATADDPAVRAAAGRVAQAAGRPMVDGRFLFALPLVAPVLDFTASVSHGEPLPRALAGAIGGAVGADLGGRIGLAACGGEAAATQGAGLIVCPALTAVGGALGAQAGKGAALHVYDKLAGPPEDHAGPADPPHAGRSGAGTGARAGSITPGSRPGSGG